MTDPEDIPEPDRVPGAPHPRHSPRVIGQDGAIAEFVDAARGGRLHHGWLLTGPRGTGKATLAWAIARWLLSGMAGDDLSVPEDAPEARRVSALSEPRLQLIRRPWDDKAGRLRAEITVDEIRRLLSFFHLSSAEGGHRIAIIDAADELNTAAANALLKVLEEPPKDALILLVAHQPARLLPTIRSRCRTLRLAPLAPAQMTRVLAGMGIDEDAEALAALSDGSVGEALRLAGQDGLARYQQIV
ncbi:DNA polymerase III subunit delta', partial [Paracoccus siganidrum]